jgi:PAS domain S-box-containing protein
MGSMPKLSRDLLDRSDARYALAIVSVLVAFLLQSALVQSLDLPLPVFILFYPAVMVTAVLAGLGPGLLATALSALLTDYRLLDPIGNFTIAKISDSVTLIIFTGMGVFISLLAEHSRRSQRHLAALKRKQTLRETQEKLRQSEEELHEHRARLEVAMGSMMDAVFISDINGRIVEFNEAFATFHKFKNKSECAENIADYPAIFDVRTPDEAAVPLDMWPVSRALRGETAINAEYLIRRKDTRESWVGSYSFSPIRDHEGVITGSVVVCRDITAHKHAEEHIRRLNRVYSVLSDITQTIVREKDSQKMLEAACRIAAEKGKFRLAWIGMISPGTLNVDVIASSSNSAEYLTHPTISLQDPYVATGMTARCFSTDAHVVCNDIEHDPLRLPWREVALHSGFRSSARLPLRCEGEIVGVFNLYSSEIGFFDEDELRLLDEMAMDISFALEVNRHEAARQRSEEELRWRTAFFEAQVESSLDGVLVVDRQGVKILQNQRLNELMKIPVDISGNKMDEQQLQFVTAIVKNPEQFLERVRYLNAHPDEINRDEVELVDGTILDRTSSPVKDKAGNYYGRIWTFREITEQRLMEDQFRQAQKMEAIGQLTGGIAHDFNNLLTVVMGCAEVIRNKVQDQPQLHKMAGLIMNAAQRGADMTHRMLAFARRQTLLPRTVNVHQVVADVKTLLLRTLSADIELEVKQECEVCDALIDPTQLESALLNLCLNSRDAMPNGGKLRIVTGEALLTASDVHQVPGAKPGEYIVVTVTDTGDGIPAEILGRVFDPFFTTKEKGKGTGLGLSMVYGFAKQSQGHVKIESRTGVGTSVMLYLPRAEQRDPSAGSSGEPVLDLHGSELILLVEDDEQVREFAESQLLDLGYRVLVAVNGKDALNTAREHPDIDLLFTDIVMPGGINGHELAQQACSFLPRLKVLYTSGYAEHTIFQDDSFGDLQILKKPYSRIELAQKVHEVLLQR